MASGLEKRGPLTMGLLWVTMVTAFPTVLIGVEWHKQGFGLAQVVACTLFGANLLLLYTVPAALIGAVTGKTFASLASDVFGRKGCHFATINVFWMFPVFYGMTALFMADAVTGLFHPPVSMPVLSFIFALLMCLNNFWGFSGVVNFARYFAAPCLIVWVLLTFVRAFAGLAASPGGIEAMLHTPAVAAAGTTVEPSWPLAMTVISSFIVGFAAWGNEADYWRHGEPKVMSTALPVAAALLIGEVIFPITGWMVAQLFHVTDTATATNVLNKFSFGGLSSIACLVIGAQYFASQDSNIYGVVSAVDSYVKVPKRIILVAYALVGGAIAVWLSITGLTKSLEAITSLNCVFLPGTTVIIIAEWWLGRYLKSKRGDEREEELEQPTARIRILDDELKVVVPDFRWAAVIALLCAYTVGVVTSGVVPGTEAFHFGIPFLFAWLTGVIIYVPLRLLR
jgi:purine-cytosine permease-like protein